MRNALNPPQSRNLLPPSIRYSSRTVRADLPPAMDPLPRTMDPLPRRCRTPRHRRRQALLDTPRAKAKVKTRTLPSRYPEGVLTRHHQRPNRTRSVPPQRPAAGCRRDPPAGGRSEDRRVHRSSMGHRHLVARPAARLPPHRRLRTQRRERRTPPPTTRASTCPGSSPARTPCSLLALPVARRLSLHEHAFVCRHPQHHPGRRYVTTRGGYGYGSCADGTCIIAPAITTSIRESPYGALERIALGVVRSQRSRTSTSQSSLSAVDLAAELFRVRTALRRRRGSLRERLAQDAGDTDTRAPLGYALLLSRQPRPASAHSPRRISPIRARVRPLDLDAVGIAQHRCAILRARLSRSPTAQSRPTRTSPPRHSCRPASASTLP